VSGSDLRVALFNDNIIRLFRDSGDQMKQIPREGMLRLVVPPVAAPERRCIWELFEQPGRAARGLRKNPSDYRLP
jgi:hypothetical protein